VFREPGINKATNIGIYSLQSDPGGKYMENTLPKPIVPVIPAMKTRIPVTRRERWSWYLYDFGNSAYAAVVTLAIYSAYFKQTVVGGAEGSRLWGLSVGIAMLVVAVLSPILGTLADFSGSKKRFLLGFTVLACVFTAMLFFVQKGDVFIGMLFFILAEIGYRGAQVFYNALLPEISDEKEIGQVSGNGWAIGSLGGIICLVIVLAMVMFIGGPLILRLSFVFAALYFAVASIPTFLYIRERAEPQTLPAGETYFTIPFRQLKQTFKAVKHYKEFIKFIVAFLIFNDGIMMTLDFAAIIGAVMFGMNQQQLIIFMILVQVTSVVGAYVFGILADKIGCKASLAISILLMIVTVTGLFFADSLTFFYIIGALAGFSLTGVQSVSRTMVSVMAPPERSAEFYGFFEVGGRTSSFLGPTIYGFIAAEMAQYYAARGIETFKAEQMGLHIAVLSIAAFLVIGLVFLMFVRQKRHLAYIAAETNLS
jgi:MFS transporter, UMF1 family